MISLSADAAGAAEHELVVDPALGQRLRFERGADPDGSEVLDVEIWIDPGGGVTPHVHPAMEERFEMLEGKVDFLAGRSWASAGPGETVVVPAGTRHAYRNRSAEPAHLVCHVRPPSSLQEFLEQIAALSRSGGISSRGLPKGPRALLRGIAIAERHREMVELGSPMPPRAVQRLLFPPLARLAARRGLGA